jgi:hypothetical protein
MNGCCPTVGLIGCPASFQRLTEKLMDNINNIIVYIDHLLVHSQSHEQHLMSLELVMQRLEENNKKINHSKCFSSTWRSIILDSD